VRNTDRGANYYGHTKRKIYRYRPGGGACHVSAVAGAEYERVMTVGALQKMRWRLVLVPLMVFVACNSVMAEDASDVLRLAGEPKQYVERFLDNPKVSGNLIVGVRWASADENPAAHGNFDARNVHLVIPARLSAKRACVNITSKDGRYSAENLYALPADVVREPKLDADTKYKIQLSENYSIDSIAVLARTGSSCDTAEFGEIIPAVLVPNGVELSAALSAVSTLVVDINADPESVELSLQKKGGLGLSATCESAGEGVRISYSTICKFYPRIRLESGEYGITLIIKERFRKVKTPEFKLLVSE
jgi:hypothetical protein